LSKWNLEIRSSDVNEQVFLTFDDVPHQEVQLSRNNCYLPAAITAQTYAVRNGTRDQDNPTPRTTIRTDQYIRRAFGPDQLYRRIMHNKGGKAIDVFKNLSALPTKINAEISATDFSANVALDHLKKYGAGLVTGFHVDDDEFRNTSTRKPVTSWFWSAIAKNEKTQEVVSAWLLLQNWWRNKQFVEVTLEYFQSSKSTVYFPTQTHTKFKDLFTMTDENFTETDFDDGGDEQDDEEEDADHDDVQFASEPADVEGRCACTRVVSCC